MIIKKTRNEELLRDSYQIRLLLLMWAAVLKTATGKNFQYIVSLRTYLYSHQDLICFLLKKFPKTILRNCLHSLVAGTKRRPSLLLFSCCDYTLQNRSPKAVLFKNLNWWAHLGKRCFASSLSTWLTSWFRGINTDFQCLPAIVDD